jgi:hypothetical protein
MNIDFSLSQDFHCIIAAIILLQANEFVFADATL